MKLCHEPPTKPKITNKQSFILQKNAKVNLDFAARVIHGVTLPEAVMKTRIRRLYDIANILQSLQLIQKVQVTESNGVKKPAFQYIGPDVDSMGKFFFKYICFYQNCSNNSNLSNLSIWNLSGTTELTN